MELRNEEMESEDMVLRDERKDLREIVEVESKDGSGQPHDI